jgi:uncharacterized membrane protein YidH (DUF202 family)
MMILNKSKLKSLINKTMEDWNKNEWQGRRKYQYEFSTRVLWYSTLMILFIVTVTVLCS